MNKLLDIVQKTTKTIVAKTKKNSPTILIFGGIGVGIVGAISVGVATKKAMPKVEEAKAVIKDAHSKIDQAGLEKKESNKVLMPIYANYAFEVGKLYLIPVSLGLVSIASILAGNKILKNRYVAVAAGYTTLMKEFKDYRTRVKNKYGEDEERYIRYGLESLPIKDEQGSDEKVIVPDETFYVNPNGYSEYAKIFDETNPYWEKSAEYNKSLLWAKQSYFNDLLQSEGHLFLNDVYKALGFPPTKSGQIVGWLYKPQDKEYPGDGYVDFGIVEVSNPKHNDFVNGYERNIILDFNVDGPIIDLI